jgi:iron complex transport system substrate-binding protein
MSAWRLFLLLLCVASVAQAAPRPQRIVSLNLCADQYLIALADRSQIAALTSVSRDPALSPVVAAARTYPVTAGHAEEVYSLRPDLVIAGPYQNRETRGLLDARGLRIVDLPSAESYAHIVAQVRRVAALVGHPARGEALVGRMDAALARLPRDSSGLVAADYQRRGYLTGTGTLTDELMRRVGLVNLATRLNRPALSRLSIEELVAARPDFLLVEGSDAIEDQGTELLHHPVLAGIHRLRVPQASMACGGPSFIAAAASLARQLRAVRSGHERRRPRSAPGSRS